MYVMLNTTGSTQAIVSVFGVGASFTTNKGSFRIHGRSLDGGIVYEKLDLSTGQWSKEGVTALEAVDGEWVGLGVRPIPEPPDRDAQTLARFGKYGARHSIPTVE